MIRVVIVDDHPALRAGLHTVLDAEPGIVFVGECSGTEESLWPLLHTTAPDVVLMDYHLPRGDGLQLCYRIKRHIPPPKVIIYSAYASPKLALPALLAHADGLVSKGVNALGVFEAIRAVDKGQRLIEPVSPAAWADAQAQIPTEDQPLVAMLVEGATEHDVADALGLSAADVEHRVQRLLSLLRLDVPATPA